MKRGEEEKGCVAVTILNKVVNKGLSKKTTFDQGFHEGDGVILVVIWGKEHSWQKERPEQKPSGEIVKEEQGGI